MSSDLENGLPNVGEEFGLPKDVVDNSALKLLGYTFTESGTSYYLVKPLQPYVIVGRLLKPQDDGVDDILAELGDSTNIEEDDEDIDDAPMMEFELLTQQEEKMLIPKLEKICKEQMAAKGLTFQDQDNQNNNKTNE